MVCADNFHNAWVKFRVNLSLTRDGACAKTAHSCCRTFLIFFVCMGAVVYHDGVFTGFFDEIDDFW